MDRGIGGMLELLSPLESVQESRKKFITARRKKLLLTGTAFLLLILAISVKGVLEPGEDVQDGIRRPQKGEKLIDFTVTDGTFQKDISILVEPRRLTDAEAICEMERVFTELPERIRGDNPSLQEIMYALELPEQLSDSSVQIAWFSADTQLLTSDGTVHNRELEEPAVVELKAVLTYGSIQRQQVYELCVLPYPYSDRELFEHLVSREVEGAAEDSAQEEYQRLPEQIATGQLTWTKKESNSVGLLVIAGLFALYLVYAGEETALKRKLKKRELELSMDFPDFLSQFLLMLGSGMNIRGIWERMADDYRKSGKRRFVYDEMLRALAQMEVGMPESSAYEQFGRRCGQLPYLRFSTIVVQNLKKGSGGISELLRAESVAVFSERKALAKRRGEEAGTKLLLPMGGMLILVLVVIIVPAFAGFAM